MAKINKVEENTVRVLIINEETQELIENKLINEELADQISGIVEDGFIETYEECEIVCSTVAEMLDDAGIDTDGHDDMLKVLKDLKLVKKDVNTESNKTKKPIKTKEKKIKKIKPKKLVRKKKIEMCGCE